MRTVMVTGATSGIGREVTLQLARAGDTVIACGRRQDRLHDLAEGLGDRVHGLVLDVVDADAVRDAVRSLPRSLGAIDVLVNNAGLAAGMSPAHEARRDDWERMIAVNCSGLVNVTHAVLPGMVARGHGLVVNVGSIAATYAYPGGNVYGATKAFVRQLSLNLRADLRGSGVRVACVEPGMVGGTEFSQVRFDGDEARAQAVYAGAEPLTPADVASTITWIASLPPHVNINLLEVMPTAQSPAAPDVWREPSDGS